MIFEPSSVTKEGDPRDVVFRRYSVPGVAHVRYWEDRELFKRLLDEVIDPVVTEDTQPSPASNAASQAEGSSQKSQFLKKDFWEKEGAYAKGQVWAYFRIPFVTAVVTFGLLVYGFTDLIDQMENIIDKKVELKKYSQSWWPLLKTAMATTTWEIDRVVALVAAIALWVCPNPLKGYEYEAAQDPEQAHKRSGWHRWRPRRSIFSHLVAGAVEWRAVLKRLSQREVRADSDVPNFKTTGLWKYGWWRVLLFGVGPLGGSLYWLLGWPPNTLAVWGLLWGATYLGVIAYILVCYERTTPVRSSIDEEFP